MNPTHIKDLIQDPKNARKHNPRNVGTIVNSLHEVGAGRSIVIDEKNVILAGNATIEAAGEAGIERVRVIEADGNEIIAVKRSGLTQKQKSKLALYDNRTAELAEWDMDNLKIEMEQMNQEEIQRLGFEDEELEKLLSESSEQLSEKSEQCPKIRLVRVMVSIDPDKMIDDSKLLNKLNKFSEVHVCENRE